jgi:hypothetical protein
MRVDDAWLVCQPQIDPAVELGGGAATSPGGEVPAWALHQFRRDVEKRTTTIHVQPS